MLQRWLRTAILIILATGCGDGPTAPPTPVATVQMSKDSATLVPAAFLDLSAQPLDAKNAVLSRTILWSSTNAAVATVASGHVTAVAPGKATIVASAGGVTGQTAIVVKQGALVGPNGGTLSLANGKVVIVFPIGALASTVQLTVDSVAAPPASPRLVQNTAFSVESDPAVATLVPFTLTLGYDPANLKTGGSESRLKIYHAVGGKWERVTSSAPNTSNHTVSALVTSLGVYAILEEAPYLLELSAGDKQTATVGTAVTVTPAVKIVDAEGFAVPGKVVQFAVTSGNGSVAGIVDTTDNAGIASVGSWTLSSVAGANALTATATGVPGSPIVFTATGIAGPPLRLGFVTAPAASIVNRTTFASTVVRLIDGFGNPSAVSNVTITAALTGGAGSLGGTRIRQTNAAGEATFSDLVFSGPVGNKTVNFSSAGLAAVNSSTTITFGAPASMVAADGDIQAAIAGRSVATSPSVKLSDLDRNPVSGVSVVFSLISGGGSITGASTTTDASGIARVASWTLGSTAGENRLSASTPGFNFPSVVFVATGNAGTAGQLSLQTAPTSPARNRIPFPTQPVIQIQDSLGNNTAAAGLRVVALLVAGGGKLQGDTVAFTDAGGKATFTNLAITGAAGPRTIRFSAPGVPETSVNVVLAAGTAASISVNAGDQQTAPAGSTVFTPPSVVVRDADANPIAGAVVNFVPGAGQVTAGAAITDINGIARVGAWTLGTAAGTNTLSVSTPELPSTVLSFVATGTPGLAATISLIRGDNQSALAGRGIPAAVLFQVFDAFGNGAPNETVNFTVSSGGSLQAFNITTLSNGIAIMPPWTLGASAGTQTGTATVNGLAGQSASVIANALTVRIVTFGDSNTDYGFAGTDPEIKAASYISDYPQARRSASSGNSGYQLAGKIEALWANTYSPAITAVNHGIASTTTGSPRSTHGAPGARTISDGITRFDAEVLGWLYPWSGGEPANDFYSGPLVRQRAYVPGVQDFTYLSLGTNDAFYLIQPVQTLENIQWMIERYLRAGLPANHFIITTLAPIPAEFSGIFPQMNRGIRSLATQFGVQLIDLAAFTSNDDGLTWKNDSLHVGDSRHYAESVRTWIAQQVVGKMANVTKPVE